MSNSQTQTMTNGDSSSKLIDVSVVHFIPLLPVMYDTSDSNCSLNP